MLLEICIMIWCMDAYHMKIGVFRFTKLFLHMVREIFDISFCFILVSTSFCGGCLFSFFWNG
ncbi:hypothetical protein Tsubulata_025031 [Turnera subulata]|uniref:Uncharacterized protein n=1 Tax=Turnera subulata TaxID=218843 RepID=A0A9Q0J9S2_9ROSI|nr:hypothetical protein Tsubulata_025031 [Turnera subulata]